MAAPPVSDADHEYTNRLVDETSPYLQQHAHNPVDWYPWGEEAFAKAREQDKPIFLSVGYSTCYWCHVMEKESFEDEEVAALLNEHFVAIKVDREERPDVDEQYMLATQIITRRGGWPNSVWLTPDGRPWMAGTYFPKPQFMQLLNNLAEAWRTRRKEIDAQADQLAQVIAQVGSGAAVGPTQAEVGPGLFNNAIDALTESFDEQHGGFGQAPKFPPHGVLRALMRQYERTGDEEYLDAVVQTLDAMWLSGMHDHVGGGFHRYATDREWLLPHFEKMLYDNAQLLHNYADAYALTNEPRFRRAADDIVGWIRREMTHERGGFYSAIDSGEVGEEGEAYVWHYREILDVLGEDDGRLVMELYNVEEAGNFREEATGERPGTNILHLSRSLEEDAAQRRQDAEAWHARLENLREKLLTERDTWPQPHKDDKILASWNGLMIGALAHAGRLLEEPAYTQAARDGADFILDEMVQPDGTLLRVYREGEAKQPGFLDDYAYFTEALLELYEATDESHWLEHAETLGDFMIDRFYDQPNGGFFYTPDQGDELLVRSKGLSGGGNIPAPNGVAAQALLRLASYTDEGHYREPAERTVRSLAGTIANSPHAAESLLLAAFALEDEPARPEPNTGEAAGTQKEPSSDTETGHESSISDDMLRNPDAEASFSAVHARAFASRLNVKPGETVNVVVVLDIDEGWHLYGQNPDVAFLVPTEVSVKSDDTLNPGEVGVPEPQAKEDPFVGQVVNTYEGRIWYSVPVEVDPATPDGTSAVEIELRVQACDANRCMPPADRTLNLPIRIDDDASSSDRHRDLMQVVQRSHVE